MPDVNILVYAHRKETENHNRYADWLIDTVDSNQPFALSELVLSGFLRIVTNKKIFSPASNLSQALSFIEEITAMENCCLIRPGEDHFGIFKDLCKETSCSGKVIADAYHAALAIEYGCTWVTADTDFAKFQRTLRWKHL